MIQLYHGFNLGIHGITDFTLCVCDDNVLIKYS